jgi:hypothetical protein
MVVDNQVKIYLEYCILRISGICAMVFNKHHFELLPSGITPLQRGRW